MKNKLTKITAEPGKQEIIIERGFDAPRELVFKAFTDPKLYTQWLGPRGLTMTIETCEPRKGGSWRYIQQDANGNEFAFHGVNHEVTSPERNIRGRLPLVRTNIPGTRKDIFMGCNTGGVYG